jgi:hypothetical protein
MISRKILDLPEKVKMQDGRSTFITFSEFEVPEPLEGPPEETLSYRPSHQGSRRRNRLSNRRSHQRSHQK